MDIDNSWGSFTYFLNRVYASQKSKAKETIQPTGVDCARTRKKQEVVKKQCYLLGNMSLQMEDVENRLITESAPIGSDRLEGQRCKYAKKSYMYKYDLGHISL